MQQHGEPQQHDQELRETVPGRQQILQRLEGQLLAMSSDQRRQQQLLLARETGHVGVLQQVGTVPLILRVRDVQTGFVQPRGPSQHGFGQRVLQTPLGLDLLEQGHRRRFDAAGLNFIDVVAFLHGAHAAHARIFIGESSHQVVQQPFAHGTLGLADPVDAEVFDDFEENRHAGWKHRGALGVHILEIELIHMTRRDHALGERAQVVESDARRVGIEPAHHLADGAHRPGAAEGLQPAELAVGLLYGLEFEPHRRARALEALFGDPAVVETDGAQADATHRQALEQQGIERLADHHLGRAAADVDHQPLVRTHRAGVHHAGVDQPRLFQSGDDFDGMAERRAGALQEPALALGAAQGIGADHPHAVGMHGAQPLTEAFETAQGALRRRLVQPPAAIQACGQTHHLAQPIQNDQLAVRLTRHDHVKAVGAQIDGREDVGYDTAAAHLAGHLLRLRMKTRNRRLSSRSGCE